MNAVDKNQVETEVKGLLNLLLTNYELFEDGVISKKHYNRNRKLINERVTTLVDTFLVVK